uniref:RdRp n=1 Tax=viral metagenome TaxID=1070528 RepID=A0A2V0RBR4_9ZZZZ
MVTEKALSANDSSLGAWFALNAWHTPVQLEKTDKLSFEELANVLDLEVKVAEIGKQGAGLAFYEKIRNDDRKFYPLKQHIGAQTKVNVFFRDVFRDVVEYHEDVSDLWVSLGTDGFFNDEASGWLMWLVVAKQVVGLERAAKFFSLLRDEDSAKVISNAVKGLGLTTTGWGSLVCEINCLKGRGVGEPSPNEDVKARIDAKEFIGNKSCGIGEEIRPMVRRVIASEMLKTPVWKSKEDVWDRRWLTTKAGAHSQFFETKALGGKLNLPELPTRREFSENCKDNMIAYGSPIVEAGLSWKLEHGKTRAIYSCDTRSYFTFDYLLKPVEEVWSNRATLLNPGKNREDVLYKKISGAGECKVMLDYDDFNSQHSIEAMQVVIEEATIGAPAEIREWAVESLQNMYVHWHDGESLKRERMVGTLPSGHRATTFINTILNTAYIWHVNGGPPELDMLHTGDDVVGSGTVENCEKLMQTVLGSSLRTNVSKQAIGRRGEFLRAGFNNDLARGYVPRAISSLVSGNWLTLGTNSKVSFVNSVLGACWNVAVRSQFREIGLLLRTTFERRVEELGVYTCPLLTFKISFDGTPVWSASKYKGLMLRYSEGGIRKVRVRSGKSHATNDYLNKFVNNEVLQMFGVKRSDVKRVMLAASYKPREEGSPKLRIVAVPHDAPLPIREDFRLRAVAREEFATTFLSGKSLSSEERQCLRALTATAGTKVLQRWPISCLGRLTWQILNQMASIITTPAVVTPHYAVLK